MACLNYEKLSRIEFFKLISARNRVQHMNVDQVKLKVIGIKKKDEKEEKSEFETSNPEDIENKGSLESKEASVT